MKHYRINKYIILISLVIIIICTFSNITLNDKVENEKKEALANEEYRKSEEINKKLNDSIPTPIEILALKLSNIDKSPYHYVNPVCILKNISDYPITNLVFSDGYEEHKLEWDGSILDKNQIACLKPNDEMCYTIYYEDSSHGAYTTEYYLESYDLWINNELVHYDLGKRDLLMTYDIVQAGEKLVFEFGESNGIDSCHYYTFPEKSENWAYDYIVLTYIEKQ